MRKAGVVIASFVVAMLMSGGWSAAVAQGDITGGWLVTGWENANGANPSPQRGLFIFAESGQYSMMYVGGTDERATYTGESITDAEKLAAYDSFIANSGRYTIEGDQLTLEAYMAKDPNYMANWGENAVTVTYSIDGDTLTLRWTGADGAFAGQSATLRRPGGG